ncbi:hypothetical protein LTR84_005289 [Exophiala bonariae]|uniref:Uncharacterized protein n=1 Tax=Exophiala bonariae TaxID=1690606 RepID=A0AAV9NRZ1_9EURO|nr:hypothetical protein LTR84_005289 [Exophiala bonariae]
MTATERTSPSLPGSSPLLVGSDWKHAGFDDDAWKGSYNLVDLDLYNVAVLQLNPPVTEDELDDRVALEAKGLGLLPIRPASDVESVIPSRSTATIRSNSFNQGSIQSYSTAPTSCASSEYSHAIQPSPMLEKPSAASENPTSSSLPKKPGSPFRRGFRRVTGFRKRRSTTLASSSLSSISSDAGVNDPDSELSIKSDLKSPVSIKSTQSSWSHPLSATKSSYDHQDLYDSDAIERSRNCKAMLMLRTIQLEEKERFLQFQSGVISDSKVQCDRIKAQKRKDWDKIMTDQIEKKEKAVEELEARQLEAELKILKEHETEKRAVMTRLRHMEAYCRNPTPPPTPVEVASGRPSTDSMPERKVTEKDYHSLAQQYRERDAMDTLHMSKINVLRGKQKKAVENLIDKRDREISKLEQELERELSAVEQQYTNQQTNAILILTEKRSRLEARWQTQALIQRKNVEKATGLPHAPLPDVVAIEHSEEATCS